MLFLISPHYRDVPALSELGQLRGWLVCLIMKYCPSPAGSHVRISPDVCGEAGHTLDEARVHKQQMETNAPHLDPAGVT